MKLNKVFLGKIRTFNRHFEDGALLIEDGVIKFVGHKNDLIKSKFLENKDICEYVLKEDEIIYPGLIDIHSHLGMYEEVSGFENLNESSRLISDDIVSAYSVRFMDSSILDSAITGGVTTASVLTGSSNIVGGYGSVIKLNGKREILKERESLKISLGSNILKENSHVKTSMEIRNILFKYLEKEKMRLLMEDTKIRVHCHRYEDILCAIDIKKRFGLNVTVEHGTESSFALEELKENNVKVNLGPFFVGRPKEEMRNLNYELPKILFEAGLLQGLMTDYPSNPPGFVRMAMMEAIKYGVPKEEALYLVTKGAASFLGVDDKVGDLDFGLSGDFIITNGDIFSYYTRVLKTFINGEEVKWISAN